MNLAIITASAFLWGLFESEEACKQSLLSELEATAEIARAAGELEAAAAATKAALKVTVISMNETDSACDYYVDGPHLRRK